MKYIEPFKRWGPYRELSAEEWEGVLELLEKFKAKLTVGVTAAWAVNENLQIPFPEKFPRQAAVLQNGVQRGLLEIANHGYVHCVLQENQFKPKLFTGNRKFHREFWDWIPEDIQEQHISQSQNILQDWLGQNVVTFIPPGNVFSDVTLKIASRLGIKYLSCQTEPRAAYGIQILGNKNVIPFHDRDLVTSGLSWLESLLTQKGNVKWNFVRELGKSE